MANDLGEWRLNAIESDDDGQEYIRMDFLVVSDEGSESFATSMQFDEAEEFAYAILALVRVSRNNA